MLRVKKRLSGKKQKNSELDDDLEIISMNDVNEDRKKEPKKRSDKIRIAVMIASAIVFVVAGYQLFSIYQEYKKGEDEYGGIEEDFAQVVDTPELTGESVEPVSSEAAAPDNNKIMPYKKVNVDFAGLKAINNEVVAWVQFEHVSISYPVVQHSDNTYYLKKTFKKTDNSAGSIFMDSENKSSFKDSNTFIYGHNMKNGSMFGLMGQFKKESFYRGRECFWIYTPTADYRFQIFAAYEPKEDSEMYMWWSGPCDAFGEYLKKAKKMSLYDTGITVSKNDKVVTLSTCTSKGKEYRFVVQGKLIQTIPK